MKRREFVTTAFSGLAIGRAAAFGTTPKTGEESGVPDTNPRATSGDPIEPTWRSASP